MRRSNVSAAARASSRWIRSPRSSVMSTEVGSRSQPPRVDRGPARKPARGQDWPPHSSGIMPRTMSRLILLALALPLFGAVDGDGTTPLHQASYRDDVKEAD